MNKSANILVLGANGLVGSAIKRELLKQGYLSISSPSRDELNLLNQENVYSYFKKLKPDFVFFAAAKVGGIQANNIYRADFLHQNLIIQSNIFQACHENKVQKLLFLGSSCIYPKECPQPIKEEYLLTGPLEQTNEPYAIAKIAGLKLAESFRRQYNHNFFAAMPTNLYGENDNFHPENSHVIPALIQRMATAVEEGHDTFEVWGSGKPKREFLYVDDLAVACVFLLQTDKNLPFFINVGTGEDITIKELAQTLAKVMNFNGQIIFNTDKPDGTMRKVMDVSKINDLGWKHKTSLEEGLKKTVKFYLESSKIRRY